MNPKQIYICKKAKDFSLCEKILTHFPDAKKTEIESSESLLPVENLRRQVISDKRSLLLDVQQGPLLRPLSRPYGQGKPEYYLYAETGCPFDCQYCFLQQWLSSPMPTIFVNRENLLEQIADAVAENGGELYLHAGEVSDALVWDFCTGLSDIFIEACRCHPGLTIEMRTKSVAIENLLNRKPPQNLVLSWTLSPENAIANYEPLTSKLQQRLEAIGNVSKAGYPVALRLDPMICEGDFIEDYSTLIKTIAAKLEKPPVDISAGSMRMTTGCLKMARHRFTRSRLFAGELVACSDGKWRYARPIRKRAYDGVKSAVSQTWGIDVALCMEPD